MEEVYSEKFNWQTNPGAVKWNGRGSLGNLVSNGVYFINLEFSENSTSEQSDHWLKLGGSEIMRIKIITTFLFLTLSTTAQDYSGYAGNYLNNGSDARSIAMGNGF